MIHRKSLAKHGFVNSLYSEKSKITFRNHIVGCRGFAHKKKGTPHNKKGRPHNKKGKPHNKKGTPHNKKGSPHEP